MRLLASFFCAFFLLTASAAPEVQAAQNKRPAAVKKVNTTKTAKAPAKKTASAKKASKGKKNVAAARKTTKKVSSSASRKFASSKHYAKKRKTYARRHVRGPSYAQLMGLRGSSDPLALSTTAVLAYDMENDQILYEKNADTSLPIASITKLMTALVIVESGVDLDQKFAVTTEDFVKSSARSKLRKGMVLSRKQALHLALMSSDNRAAHFLARTFPGGKAKFISEMNAKAVLLAMDDSVFYDSIGLNNGNKCSALDLSHLIAAAAEHDVIRDLSTTPEASFSVGKRYVVSRTTNSFVANDNWDIELQKTGLTTAAGYCMVMQTNISGRPVAMIFLDAPNKAARNHDIQKLHDWLTNGKMLETASLN